MNGHDERVIELLQGIWGEMKTLNGRIDRVREELRQEMREGFEKLSGRIDNVLLGEHRHEHAELRERIARLEVHAGLPR